MGKKAEEAKKLDQDGYCLLCNEKKDNRCRGLCQKHYKQFHKERSSMDQDQQKEFEDRLIRLGFLLASKKRGRQTGLTVFEEVRRKLVS